MIKPVMVDGRMWKPFLCSFDSPDGTFGFTIMAISVEHAAALLEDLRQSARLDGELKQVINV